jgi:Predicted carbamoyl transferase, NodU family
MTWLDTNINIGKVYSNKLIELFGPERRDKEVITQKHKDIAASAQETYQNIFLNIIKQLYKKNNSKYLCISGGCGMNSVANGKILENSDYKKIYVQSNPGDGGGSIGAAAYLIKKIKKNVEFNNDTPFLGPSFSHSEIKKTVEKNKSQIDKENIEVNFYDDENQLIEILSKYIAEGLIVGLFHGKMEFGPRALGNRSIIADPRKKNIREILNLKIKRRESFRPFAPSILEKRSF